jgi:hypothetical protein
LRREFSGRHFLAHFFFAVEKEVGRRQGENKILKLQEKAPLAILHDFEEFLFQQTNYAATT